ncbi:unnamed protein product [Peniophora sp. CBMAI 1063]|nr:unnamed protein product [Peniophora sp. CBMAI 1063]
MRTTLALATFSALTLPALAGHDGSAFSRRHAGQHAKRGDSQLAKRQTFSNARFSFYDVTAGEVACGGFYQNGYAIVALNAQQFDGGSHCGETITITYQGTTKSAKIVDECMGCGSYLPPPNDGGLDLAQDFFTDFASADAGIIYGSWVGLGGSDPAPEPTTTKEKPKPTTTSTTPAWTPPPTTSTHKTTSTSVWTPPPTTTHTTSTTPTTTAEPSTSAKPTTSSAAPTTSSAPSLPTAGLAADVSLNLVDSPSVQDLSGTQNIVDLYGAIVNLGAMVMH